MLGQRLGCVGKGLAFLNLGDERSEDIDRSQEDIGKGLDFVQSPASERPEEVLHGMRQLRHSAVADCRSRALEGMSGPKDFVDHGGVEAVLEFEQTLFDPLDLLEGFVRKETVVPRLQIEGQKHARAPLGGRREA